MVIYGVTRQNCIGKYDEFHCCPERARQRFSGLKTSIPEGDRLLLLKIDLAGQKRVTKLDEYTK